jgi:hypothetical protein
MNESDLIETRLTTNRLQLSIFAFTMPHRDLFWMEAFPSFPAFLRFLPRRRYCALLKRRSTLAVLEVGMGGRLDATNIVDPLISVITDISLDHTEWLGSTIAAITREKAGILRRQRHADHASAAP